MRGCEKFNFSQPQSLKKKIIMLKSKNVLPVFIILIIILYIIKIPVIGTESLRTGLLILQNKTLNIHSQYLFTLSPDDKLINPQWLFQILKALIYKLGGLELINILFALIIALNFILIYKFIYSLTKNIKFSSLLCLIIFVLSIQFLSFRAVITAALFCLIILYIVKIKDKYLFFIPLITLLWVNIHLSFPIIFVILSIKIIDIIYKDYKNKLKFINILQNKRLQYYLIITVLSLLFTLINPFGIKIFKEVLIIFNKNSILTFITEWVPTTIHEITGLAFFIVSLGLFYIIFQTKEKLPLFDLLIILFFYFFALSAIRNILWWNIIVMPISSIYIYNFILKTKLKKRLTIIYMNHTVFNQFILILLIGLIFLSSPYFRKYNFLLKNKIYQNNYPDNPFSVKLIKYLLCKKSYNKNRIFLTGVNSDSYFFYLAPNYKFISGELVGYFRKEIEEYQLISAGLYNYHKLLSKYKINYLILNREDQYFLIKALLKDNNYKLLLSNNKEYLFEKIL